MEITVNGKPHTLAEPLSVRQALAQFGPPRGHAAIWLNGQSVLLREYDTRMLAAGDELKIIRISGGG